jgi:tRNA pseudouridine32 synthase/23S rRNA pseudouridine746 synthase
MQFERRQVKKTYVARVSGEVKQKSGLIDLPLVVDWANRPRQMVCHETGKLALTEWHKLSSNQNESRLRLVPKTGRSHQLRVHCMAFGHPILGDPIYGEGSTHDRMMLHSEELRVKHPENGFGSRFRSKAPF